jgi:sugar lactone lactonase YvrE
MNGFRIFLRPGSAAAVATVVFLVLAGGLSAGRENSPQDIVAEIAAQIENARDALREEGKCAEALNLLTPVLARLLSVPEAKQRIALSAEVFFLRGMAEICLGDETAARREFQSLYALDPDVARTMTKNVFDPKILSLLKQAERESRGENTAYVLGLISEPPGATVRIDGQEIGMTPVLYQAPGPGSIVVEIEKPGYESVRDEVAIEQYETRREYELKAVNMSARIRSIPTGAKVFLDGQDTGQVSETELSGLTPGPHRLRLLLPGFREEETVLEPTLENPRLEWEVRLIAANYLPAGTWGGLESTLLKSPVVIARGISGTFVIGDSSDVKLKIFDEKGGLIWRSEPGILAEMGLLHIGGLAVASSGNFILSDSENHVIFQLRPDGRMLSQWGSFGTGPGELNAPLGLAVDEDGRVYIADSGNNRVQIRSAEGIPVQTWGGPGGKVGNFRNPRAVAVRGPEVYVLDSVQVQIFARDGSLKSAWEPKGPTGEHVGDAVALAVDAEGCVFLADPRGQRILKYDPTGGFVCAWGSPGTESGEFGNPCGLVEDGRGRIYVVERDNHRVQIFQVQTGFNAPEAKTAFRGPCLETTEGRNPV